MIVLFALVAGTFAGGKFDKFGNDLGYGYGKGLGYGKGNGLGYGQGLGYGKEQGLGYGKGYGHGYGGAVYGNGVYGGFPQEKGYGKEVYGDNVKFPVAAKKNVGYNNGYNGFAKKDAYPIVGDKFDGPFNAGYGYAAPYGGKAVVAKKVVAAPFHGAYNNGAYNGAYNGVVAPGFVAPVAGYEGYGPYQGYAPSKGYGKGYNGYPVAAKEYNGYPAKKGSGYAPVVAKGFAPVEGHGYAHGYAPVAKGFAPVVAKGFAPEGYAHGHGYAPVAKGYGHGYPTVAKGYGPFNGYQSGVVAPAVSVPVVGFAGPFAKKAVVAKKVVAAPAKGFNGFKGFAPVAAKGYNGYPANNGLNGFAKKW